MLSPAINTPPQAAPRLDLESGCIRVLIANHEEFARSRQDRRSGVLLAGYGAPPESFSLVFLELMNFLAANGVSIANHPSSFSPIAGDNASLNYYLEHLNTVGADYLLYLKVDDMVWDASKLELQCFDSAGNLLWQEKAKKTFSWISTIGAKSLAKKIKKKLKPRIGKPGLPLKTGS